MTGVQTCALPIYIRGRFKLPFPAYLLLRGPLRFASTNLPFVLSSARLASSAAGGGDEQNRTVDPLLARQVLSQLSYTPISYRFASLG